MTVVIPDAQLAAIGYLSPYVPDGAVFPEVPPDYEGAELIAVVTVTGTPPRHDVVLAERRITVDVYGPDQLDTLTLAYQLHAVLLDWPNRDEGVDRPAGRDDGDVSGPQWWPDGDTRRHRYVFTVAAVLRGEEHIITPG